MAAPMLAYIQVDGFVRPCEGSSKKEQKAEIYFFHISELKNKQMNY